MLPNLTGTNLKELVVGDLFNQIKTCPLKMGHIIYQYNPNGTLKAIHQVTANNEEYLTIKDLKTNAIFKKDLQLVLTSGYYFEDGVAVDQSIMKDSFKHNEKDYVIRVLPKRYNSGHGVSLTGSEITYTLDSIRHEPLYVIMNEINGGVELKCITDDVAYDEVITEKYDVITSEMFETHYILATVAMTAPTPGPDPNTPEPTNP